MTAPDARPHVHLQRFYGDDPYLVCACGAVWDALTGKEIVAAPQPEPAPAGKGLRSRGIVAFDTGDGQRAIDRETRRPVAPEDAHCPECGATEGGHFAACSQVF